MNRAVRLALAAALGAAGAPARAMPPAAPLPAQPGRPLTPVILDAGHGGDDLGAVVKGLREKDLALTLARKLKARLSAEADIPVLMTREDDVYVPLDRRVVESVDWSGAVFVSLHFNQVRSRKPSGMTVYTYGPEKRRFWRRRRQHPSVPPMPAPPAGQARESEALARGIARALRGSGFKAELDKSDYYVLKNPSQPSVLIELGYLSNPEEAARLADPAYQDRIVGVLAKAVEDYAAARNLGAAYTTTPAKSPDL